MRKILSLRLLVVAILLSLGGSAWSRPPGNELNDSNVVGVWEAVRLVEEMAFRLIVEANGRARLAIWSKNGPTKKLFHMQRQSNWGVFSFHGKEVNDGRWIRVRGTGRATDRSGEALLEVEIENTNLRFVGDDSLHFKKSDGQAVQRLGEAARKAALLIGEAQEPKTKQ